MKVLRALLPLALALGCGSDTVTQIALTIDGKTLDPGALDKVSVEVSDAAGKRLQSSQADLGELGLPRKLTLVHDQGPLGPFRVTAAGFSGETKLVEYKTDAWFQADKTWYLRIELQAHCIGHWQRCDADETCELGECRPIATHRGQADPAVPVDTDSDGALGGPTGQAGQGATAPNLPPLCSIGRPLKDQTLFEGNDLKLEGNCSDPETGPLDSELTWTSNVDGLLGTGSALKVKANAVSLGEHTLSLCAIDLGGLRGCADQVSFQIVPKPKPPRGRIDSVSQGERRGMGPFSSDQPIDFVASGSGQEIQFAWSDNFVGNFPGDDNATLSSPLVGRHQVTVTVIDEAGQPATDTVAFDVIEATRLEEDRTTLFQPIEAVNDVLRASGEIAVTALASDSTGVAFVSNSRQVFAFQVDPRLSPASPVVIDPPADDEGDSGDTQSAPLSDVSTILIHEAQENSRIYFAAGEAILVCDYDLGEVPIARSNCNRYEDEAGDAIPGDQVTSLAHLTIGERSWLAIGTERGLQIARDDAGSAGEVIMVTSDEEHIRAVVASEGSFWFATQYAGVYRYDPSGDSIPSLFSTGAPAPPLTALAAGFTGGIWMGSEEHGLAFFDSTTSGLWQDHWMAGDPFEGLSSSRVQTITPAYGISMGLLREVIWVGTDRGVTRLDYAVPSFTTFAMEAGLPSDDVRAIALVPASGNILVGTGEGLALYNGL